MDKYRTSVRCLHQLCTTRLYHALKECGLDVARPKGSFYLYPSFRPFAAQLRQRGIRTSTDLSKWLVEEYGLAALPGSAFGEKSEELDEGVSGGSYRLRMATSYLYFLSEGEKYERGFGLLDAARDGQDVELPLLGRAVDCIRRAVGDLKRS